MATLSRGIVTPILSSRSLVRVFAGKGNHVNTLGVVGGPGYPRAIPLRSISITEANLPAGFSNWVATAYADAGLERIVGFARGTGAVVIDATDADLHIGTAFVVVRPDTGQSWYPERVIRLNQLCVPTNPITTPYVFKCTVAGVSGSTEPAWVTATPGTSTTSDGTVTWTCLARLVQPMVHGPLPVI